MEIVLQTNEFWRAIKTVYTYTFRKTIMGCNLRYYEQFKVLWPIEEEHYFDNFCLIFHLNFIVTTIEFFSLFPTAFSFSCNFSRVTMKEWKFTQFEMTMKRIQWSIQQTTPSFHALLYYVSNVMGFRIWFNFTKIIFGKFQRDT